MPTLQPQDLDTLARACLGEVGVPAVDAALVADHLVEAGLMGHDTHSVLRLPQYVNMAREGVVELGAELQVLQQSDYGAQLSGGWNYGPVTATRAVELELEKVRDGAISVVGGTRLQSRCPARSFRRIGYPRRLYLPNGGQRARR